MEEGSISAPSKAELLLTAKHALDARRINSSQLSPDAAPLVLKLLKHITQLEQPLTNPPTHATHSDCCHPHIESLLRQLESVVAENNQLNLQIIRLKDQVCLLTVRATQAWGELLDHRNDSAHQVLLTHRKQTEESLRQQLVRAIFQYNQLMDLLHEDPSSHRHYLQRLLKHKHAALDPIDPLDPLGPLGPLAPLDPLGHSSPAPPHKLQLQVAVLEAQLLSRNQEIKRLQQKLQSQCTSLLQANSNQLLRNQIALLQEELAHLACHPAPTTNPHAHTTHPHSPSYKLKRVNSHTDGTYLLQTAKQQSLNYPHQAYSSPRTDRKEGQQHTLESGPPLQSGQRQLLEINDKYLRKANTLGSKTTKNKLLPSKLPPQPTNHPHLAHSSNQQQLKGFKSKSRQGKQSIEGKQSREGKQSKKESSSSKPIVNPQNNFSQTSRLKNPHDATSAEKYGYEMLLREKDVRIQQLQQLLKTTTHQTHTFTARNTETNNLIINEHHNQYITFAAPETHHTNPHPTHLQLSKALAQCEKLRRQLQQLQKAAAANHRANKEQEHIGNNMQAADTERLLKQLKGRLFQVNQQNIGLQLKLNQALQTINSFKNNTTHHKGQPAVAARNAQPPLNNSPQGPNYNNPQGVTNIKSQGANNHNNPYQSVNNIKSQGVIKQNRQGISNYKSQGINNYKNQGISNYKSQGISNHNRQGISSQRGQAEQEIDQEAERMREERDELRVQVDDLRMRLEQLRVEMDRVRKQKLVVSMQLRETERQLELQRRDMTAFELQANRQRQAFQF